MATKVTRLVPPYRIVVDEAGDSSFSEKTASEDIWPYVIAGVCVPVLSMAQVLSTLPLDRSGVRLKASGLETTDSVAARFLTRLLESPVEVGLVLLDGSSAQNARLAERAREKANEARQAQHKKHIATATAVYVLAVKHAVLLPWG